jgi:hypothetical protein
MGPQIPGTDVPALVSVLVSGLIYNMLRAKTVDVCNGIPLNAEEGWKRLEGMASLLLELYLRDAAAKAEAAK